MYDTPLLRLSRSAYFQSAQQTKSTLSLQGCLTRIALPVKVVLRIAGALQVQLRLLTRWTMREWNVIIRDIVEEVDLVLLE